MTALTRATTTEFDRKERAAAAVALIEVELLPSVCSFEGRKRLGEHGKSSSKRAQDKGENTVANDVLLLYLKIKLRKRDK